MKRSFAGLLAILCLGHLASASAADADGNYAIWGAGGRSCNQYLMAASEAAKTARFKDFLMGYLTAYDMLAEDTYSAVGEMNLEGSLSWLNDYCSANKMDSFERAITVFVAAQHDSRLRTPPGTSSGWGRASAKPAAVPPPPTPSK